MEKKIKLSDKQKEVIKGMRNGCTIKMDLHNGDIWVDGSLSSMLISYSTFFALKKHRLTECKNKQYPVHTYQLTELGRNLQF